MATLTSTVNFELIGNKHLTDDYYTVTFTPISKTELTFHNVTTLTGLITIPIANLSAVSKILVKGTNAVLRLSTATQNMDLSVNGILYYELLATFASTLTAISISTSSVTAVDIDITIIGV
jgi:hypothetical protein